MLKIRVKVNKMCRKKSTENKPNLVFFSKDLQN